MSYRAIHGAFAIVGVVSGVSLGAILLFFPAEAAGALVLTLLFLSLALFLVSILTLVGLRVRRAYVTERNQETVIAISLREGVLVGVLVLVYLALARFDALNAWIAAVALLGMTGLEYYFLAHGRG